MLSAEHMLGKLECQLIIIKSLKWNNITASCSENHREFRIYAYNNVQPSYDLSNYSYCPF